ncbi:MAG: ABC transporter permease [Firmicutes bacterium]|nr:ABC transporter permease [Bacillota bacterium]
MSVRMRAILLPLYAIVTGIVLGGLIMLIYHYNPVSAYGALFSGAFGNASALGNTLTYAVPLVLSALGIAVAFRAGLFNIGAEGQYWMGAIVAVWVGYHLVDWPMIPHIAIALLAAMVAGALWGGVIPGLTKAFVGAHEVITTMMLSYIAIFFGHYLLEQGPMMAPGYLPQSPPVAASATLPYFAPLPTLTDGFWITIVMIILVHVLLFHTTLGYKLRAVGASANAARYGGMNIAWFTVLSLGISGGLAGLAGAVQMLGVENQLSDSFSSGYGYTAIVVSLLARNNPIGILFAGIFFAALSAGSQTMQINSGVSPYMTDVITGIVVFFVAADRLYAYLRIRLSRGAGGSPKGVKAQL